MSDPYATPPGGLLGDSFESDDPHDDTHEGGTRGGSRRAARRRRGPGCLIGLVLLGLLFGGLYFGLTKGIDFIQSQIDGTPDYSGPGTGSVVFEVQSGESSAEIGRNLKDEDIVKSVQAFIDAANANPASKTIQVGFYEMRSQMKASDALDLLVDPSNAVNDTITIPEGLRAVDVLQKLAEKTEFGIKAFEQALAKTDKLGLPDYAGGNPEGYLFPATYEFGPNAKPIDMLRAMVDRWRQAAEDVDLEAKAAQLGYTPQEMMTIASLVEAEGRGKYTVKIARVIYNRLEIEPNPSAGFLQIDATVNYALGRPGIVRLTFDEIDSVSDSPYNTYRQKGLPPTPIEAPGQAAMEAALNPAKGTWFYYVTVNLATGETKFATTPEEFQTYKNELDQYCATQSDRC